ncbi:MAG: MBL fold metallo-hydrolase [Dehalococcoidia bacterium]|nr:MBL fold metallo-hydrolase [Dehalococcoidia bacterium]
MMLRQDIEVRVSRIKCGSQGINSYIVADPRTEEGVIIDAPNELDRILEEVRDVQVKAILITHTHVDQLAGLDRLRSQTEAPVWVNANDAQVFNYFTPVNSERPEYPFHDGAILTVGPLQLRAIHTPGHTPGASCYLIGGHLFSGETLLPDGPGDTMGQESHQQSVDSILKKLFILPDAIIVHPGQGDETTLSASKAEYQAFSGRQHEPDSHGDVLWRIG